MQRRPFLNDPAPSWRRDLPTPRAPSTSQADTVHLLAAPNKVTDIYIEIPACSMRLRGILCWAGLLAILASTIPIILIIFLSTVDTNTLSLGILSAGFVTSLLTAWLGVVILRIDICLPRDQPIRFNRARRKVYAYHFDNDWKRPFSNKHWGARVATYSWENLHAEASETYGAMGTGGYIQTVYLSAIRPGTRDVAHRFVLSLDLYQGESYWEAARAFMEYGTPAMPTFQYPSKDLNNKSSLLNIFWRFAPKVQWPEHIDIESRTAPTPGEQQ